MPPPGPINRYASTPILVALAFALVVALAPTSLSAQPTSTPVPGAGVHSEIPDVPDASVFTTTLPCVSGLFTETRWTLDTKKIYRCDDGAWTTEQVVPPLPEFSFFVGDNGSSPVASTLLEHDGTRLVVGATAADAIAADSAAQLFIRAAKPSMSFQTLTGNVVAIGPRISDDVFDIIFISTSNKVAFRLGGQIVTDGIITIQAAGSANVLSWKRDGVFTNMGQFNATRHFTINHIGNIVIDCNDAGFCAFGGSTNPARPLHVFGGSRDEPQASPPASPSNGDSYIDSSGTQADCVYLDDGWVVRAGTGSCD